MNVFEICSIILTLSFTMVFSVGSLVVTCGLLMVLFGKDHD